MLNYNFSNASIFGFFGPRHHGLRDGQANLMPRPCNFGLLNNSAVACFLLHLIGHILLLLQLLLQIDRISLRPPPFQHLIIIIRY